MLLKALSHCVLNTDRCRAPTTCLGSLCQCLTTVMAQKCFPMPTPTLSCCSSVPFLSCHWCPGAESHTSLLFPAQGGAAESSEVEVAELPLVELNISSAPFLCLIQLICVATCSHTIVAPILEYFHCRESEFSFKTLFLTYLPKVLRSQFLREREKKIKTKFFCVNSIPGLTWP